MGAASTKRVTVPDGGRQMPNGLTLAQQQDMESAVVRRCPHHGNCSVPKCALDPMYHERQAHPDDLEVKCRAQRPTRMEIVDQARAEGVSAVEYLPFGGLTLKEYNAARRAEAWRARPDAEKQKVYARLAAAREKLPRQKLILCDIPAVT